MPHFAKASCPECDGHVEYDTSEWGRVTRCPHCEEVFRLPVAPKRWVKPVVYSSLIAFSLIGGAWWMWVYHEKLTVAVVNSLFAAAGTLIAIAIYMAPSYVANREGHPQFPTLTAINIFLGWTFLGWVFCLAWAFWRYAPRPLSKTTRSTE